MKKIIVTGTNGFIGRYAADRLVSEDCEIYAIDRSDRQFTDQRISYIQADLSKCESVSDVTKKINGADAMVHLAADITVPGNAVTIGNNISGMITAIEIARKTGVRHFVYLSSIPVIGDITYVPIDEKHPEHPKSAYHWSKLLGERILEEYHDAFETISVLRIPSPIGRGMRENVFLPFMLKKMICGDEVELYGSGKRIQNYIDVRDIAEAISCVIKSKAQGLYLIAGEKSVSNSELAELCRQITHSSSSIVKGKHTDTEESEQWIISCKKAASEFGYSPRYDLETTIRWICGGM